jgi:hypothetical protein
VKTRKALLRALIVAGDSSRRRRRQRLQAKAQFTFKDETFLQRTAFKPCTIKK